jgi:hypothetical protein
MAVRNRLAGTLDPSKTEASPVGGAAVGSSPGPASIVQTESAAAAAASASNAATSEGNALGHKNAAATSASNAATSEANALASKNAAAASASNAATSEANAANNNGRHNTLAAALVASVGTGVTAITVGGKSTLADDGDGLVGVYANSAAVPSGAPPTSVFTLADGVRKAKYLEKVIRPAQFGIFPATTDIRQGMIDMAAELNWRGGATVRWPDHKDFTAFATRPATQQTIITLSNQTRLDWSMCGSRILVPCDFYLNVATLTTTQASLTATIDATAAAALAALVPAINPATPATNPFVMGPGIIIGTQIANISGTTVTLSIAAARSVFQAPSAWRMNANDAIVAYGMLLNGPSKDCKIDLEIVHTHPRHATTLDPYTGVTGFVVSQGSNGVECLHRQIGGASAINIGAPVGTITDAKRSRYLDLTSDCDYTFYGTLLSGGGDNARLNVTTRHGGRSCAIFGVSEVEFTVDSESGDGFDDLVITSQGNPNAGSLADTATANIRGKYRWRNSPDNVAPKGNLVYVASYGINGGNGIVSGVHVDVDVDGYRTPLDASQHHQDRHAKRPHRWAAPDEQRHLRRTDLLLRGDAYCRGSRRLGGFLDALHAQQRRAKGARHRSRVPEPDAR